jgi:hypothetical protein
MYERRKNWVLWEGDFVLELSGLTTDAWWARIYLHEGKRAVHIWSHGPGDIDDVRKEAFKYLRALQEPTDTEIDSDLTDLAA